MKRLYLFSIFTKSYADAIFIFAVIIINALIGTYQEWNSEKNSEKLANLIKINSKVLRDEEEKQIAASIDKEMLERYKNTPKSLIDTDKNQELQKQKLLIELDL